MPINDLFQHRTDTFDEQGGRRGVRHRAHGNGYARTYLVLPHVPRVRVPPSTGLIVFDKAGGEWWRLPAYTDPRIGVQPRDVLSDLLVLGISREVMPVHHCCGLIFADNLVGHEAI